MIDRFYYTMADLYDVGDAATQPDFYADNGDSWSGIFGNASLFDELPEQDELLGYHLWPRFCNQSIGYIDMPYLPWMESAEPTIQDIKDSFDYKRLVGNIAGWLRESSEKYIPLIHLYEAQKDHLLDKIKTETTTSGSDSGTHTNKDTGFDISLHTGTNADTNKDVKTTESGVDSVVVAKTGKDTDIDSTSVTNSGIDKTTVDTSNIVNDTPQIVGDNIDSDEFASSITKQHSLTSVENGLVQTHGGQVEHDYGSTDTTTTTHGHTNTLTGSLEHTFNDKNKNDYEHSTNGGDTRTTSGSSTTTEDRESMIARLDEISDKLYSIYRKWSDEFRRFIIY